MRRSPFIPLVLMGAIIVGCGTEYKKEIDENHTIGSDVMKNINESDLAGIGKPLDLYVKAAIEGDSKIARPAFAEGATITHVENDSIVCLPIQALFDYYDQTGKQNASYEISECSVAGDIAMVRIESVFGEAQFTDMFTLARESGEWKIVSKIYSVK